MENRYPLLNLSGKKVGPFQLRLESKPLRSRQGWTQFLLYLEDKKGRVSSLKDQNEEWVPAPILQGIHSRGGRGVIGWIEVGDYHPLIHFSDLGNQTDTLSLSENKIDQQIFNLLSDAVPPGGHFMFVYEVPYESPFHQETQQGLLKGIPPVSTPQGILLFHSGCRWVKDWYLAEGGHEGLRKLWGEKPINKRELQRFDLLTFFQLLSFLSRKPNPEFLELELKARKRTRGVLSELRMDSTVSVLRDELMAIYPGDMNQETTEEFSRHCCKLIEACKKAPQKDILVREELEKILKNCLDVSSIK